RMGELWRPRCHGLSAPGMAIQQQAGPGTRGRRHARKFHRFTGGLSGVGGSDADGTGTATKAANNNLDVRGPLRIRRDGRWPPVLADGPIARTVSRPDDVSWKIEVGPPPSVGRAVPLSHDRRLGRGHLRSLGPGSG